MTCATIMAYVPPYIYTYIYTHIHGTSSNLYTPDSVPLSSLARQLPNRELPQQRVHRVLTCYAMLTWLDLVWTATFTGVVLSSCDNSCGGHIVPGGEITSPLNHASLAQALHVFAIVLLQYAKTNHEIFH